LSKKQKLELVALLKPHGKVLITGERSPEPELMPYQLKISPDKIHSLLYYATLFIGDSQTMTSEAAVLGTPALRCNSLVGKISYLEEEEKRYHLAFGFRPEQFDMLKEKVLELLKDTTLGVTFRRRRARLLGDKIDVTAFLVWFVENYPESALRMQQDPVGTQQPFRGPFKAS
jgi:predicted glycosyltransferase